jgi:hypothetical protein
MERPAPVTLKRWGHPPPPRSRSFWGRRRKVIPTMPAPGRVIDERIAAVPICVADMNDVRGTKCNGNIAVGMGAAVMFESDQRAIELERMLCCKHLGRNAAGWQGKKIVVPVLDALYLREILSGVLVRNDLGADRMEPIIAIGAVEVPMGVDQMRGRIGGEIGKRLGGLRARYPDISADEHLAVRSVAQQRCPGSLLFRSLCVMMGDTQHCP